MRLFINRKQVATAATMPWRLECYLCSLITAVLRWQLLRRINPLLLRRRVTPQLYCRTYLLASVWISSVIVAVGGASFTDTGSLNVALIRPHHPCAGGLSKPRYLKRKSVLSVQQRSAVDACGNTFLKNAIFV
jgi:hypothetical protein